MPNLITNVNAEIANNQLKEKVDNIQTALYSKLRMLKADWQSLHGKTIEESHTNSSSLTVLFTDGTHIVVETEDDSPMYSTTMTISEGFQYGLLSKDEHQTLKVAEAAIGCVRDKQSGVTELNNAIAHLGIEAVKTLVNRV